MKHDNDNVRVDRLSPRILRPLRKFWRRLVADWNAALQRDNPGLPMRVILRTRDRNRPRQHY
ncbi:hypothetical protein FFR93_28995 [Rhizobium sp. MHM7A]|nr:hypothetical protein FFR93_28995 [Rhizobium sp. MHM7A]